ncbi:MAG: hypothetical protein ACI97A_004170, partial [Planctomycetota bacterium]
MNWERWRPAGIFRLNHEASSSGEMMSCVQSAVV